jgi:hypothetical protein
MRQTRWTWAVLLMAGLLGCDGSTGMDPTEAAVVRVEPARDTLVALQDTVRLSVEVRDREGRVLTAPEVEWASLDTIVARVDSDGRVVSLAVGTARISATVGTVADTAEITVLASVAAAELTFVRFAGSTPPIETLDTSFWASREKGGEIRLRYRGGREFLRFKVPGRSLLHFPDGRPFGERDSVRIRLQLEDPTRFSFHFEPSGLRFDPKRPAELEVEYDGAEAQDIDREDELSLWRQERPDLPWVRLATVRLKDEDEVRARITGFTGFALATNRR